MINQQQDKQMEALLSHAQLFRDTLERAMHNPDGLWVNGGSATASRFYQRQGKISAYGSLLMALHSQLRGCKTNTYISYSDAIAKTIRFGDYRAGVQVPYVRQAGYRNRLSNQLISQEQFNALSREEAASYRPNFQRYLRMVYNVDQTNLSAQNPQAYNSLMRSEGPQIRRGLNPLEAECDALRDFDDQCTEYERQIVSMMPTDQKRTHYDADSDTISIACVDSYPSTDAFLQDGYRAIAAATGQPSRLDRNVSSPQAQIYEKLVQESISAMCMVQLGRTGAISEENKSLIPTWIQMLKDNPRIMYSLERDLNLANEMLLKAQAGEKVVKDIKPKPHEADMPTEDMLALKDILANGGMVANPANFPSEQAYSAMLDKYGLTELRQKLDECHSVLRDNESLLSKGLVSDQTYLQTKSEMYKELSKFGSEMSDRIVSIIPRPWDYYGRRYISNELERVVLDDRQDLILVHEPENKIVNVLVASDARQGGTVITASGEKVPFWIDPLEQLTPEQLVGATITKSQPDWFDKEKITESIKEQKGANHVRFFETQGPLGFYPPNDYYIGKEVTQSVVTDGGTKTSHVLTYDTDRIVRETCAMDFESISVIKDDNGSWVMNMMTTTGENISVYPTQADLKIFFDQCRDLTDDSLATKKQLGRKYYNLALEEPRLNVDIFNKIPEGIDPNCIERVYIYKDPRFGNQMIKPTIKGMEPVKARPLSKSQFQKIWIAPDVDRYRKALACRIFQDILPRDYGTRPMVDHAKLEALSRQTEKDSLVGISAKPLSELISSRAFSQLNTSESNRNLRNEEQPAQQQSATQSQSQTESESKSQTESESKSKSNTKTQPQAESESKTNSKSKSDTKSKNQSQSDSNSKSQTSDKSNPQKPSKSSSEQESQTKSKSSNNSSGHQQKDAQNASKDEAKKTEQIDSQNPSKGSSQTTNDGQSKDASKNQSNSNAQDISLQSSQNAAQPKDSSSYDWENDTTIKFDDQAQYTSKTTYPGNASNTKGNGENASVQSNQPSLFGDVEKYENSSLESSQNASQTTSQQPASYAESTSKPEGNNKVMEPGAGYKASLTDASVTVDETIVNDSRSQPSAQKNDSKTATPAQYATATSKPQPTQRAKVRPKDETSSTAQANAQPKSTGKGAGTEKPKSTSQTKPTTQVQTTNPQQEQMKQKPLNNPEPKKEESKAKAQQADKAVQSGDKQPERKSFLDVTITAEEILHYEKLRRTYPDAFIMITENGMAKAFGDDAFKAYDIVHDGHPVVFLQHPLSESPKDKVAVFEFPVRKVEDELPKFMKRNTSLIVSRMNAEQDQVNDRPFRLGI